ncbi:MAG: hypothetical protein HRT44_06470 [Bdellovibrionales bacterium]|nr:hypothetical protein [Bdellovibrionales bacterium]NQZ18885.1 hypothetical protein [Bdellovibrionales bacterium]
MRIVIFTSILSFLVFWLMVTMTVKMLAEPIPTFETGHDDVSQARHVEAERTQLTLK